MKTEEEETYTLSEFKTEDENTHHAGGRGGQYAEDEDEEDGGGYHKTYNCAHQ